MSAEGQDIGHEVQRARHSHLQVDFLRIHQFPQDNISVQSHQNVGHLLYDHILHSSWVDPLEVHGRYL